VEGGINEEPLVWLKKWRVIMSMRCERANTNANKALPSDTSTTKHFPFAPSPVHQKHCPSSVTNMELNTTIVLLYSESERKDVLKKVFVH
jgi:hypothetical protein